MESRNKLAMCRLCLCENECFINIFRLNDWQGYVPAEVISDLFQFQVSETDGYPHGVCSTCLTKLTEFRMFKECCQKSKVMYDNIFVSRESLEEYKPDVVEFVSVKAEPLSYSDNEDNFSEAKNGSIVTKEENSHERRPVEAINDIHDGDVFKEESMEMSCGPILLKYEVLPFGRDSHTQDIGICDSELCEEDPLREAPTKEQLTLVDAVTNSQNLQCLEHKRPHCTSKGEVDADSCTRNINANEERIFEKSNNNSFSVGYEATSSEAVERFEGQWISPGEKMHIAPLFQKDMGVGMEGVKERRSREKKKTGCEGEGGSGTGPKNGIREGKKGLECSHCGKVLMTKHGLIGHMNLHGFGQTYDCGICGRAFQSNSHLNSHIRSHTDSRPYKCTECTKSYRQNHHLVIHMRTHTGSKPYKCAECSKSFVKHSYLTTHMRTHTGSKPFKCAECSRRFSDRSNLRIHLRTHTGYKPYKCTECSDAFSVNQTLKIHMRKHTGFKPYKCGTCSKEFAQVGQLTRHNLVHTKEKAHECHNCSKRFGRREHLKSHLDRYCKGK